MIDKKTGDNTTVYNFSAGDVDYSIEILGDGCIEVYETENTDTGFIIENNKSLTSFINRFTDAIEDINQKE